MINSQAKPKVLVADDERVIADTLAIILNQSGFEATAVYSGEKAVEAARTLRPDMLISDVIMTDMNGIDAAITIQTILPNCKILLFSGQAATADLLDRALGQGHEFNPGKTRTPAGFTGAPTRLGRAARPLFGGNRLDDQTGSSAGSERNRRSRHRFLLQSFNRHFIQSIR